jgi:hypothetical protein
MAMMPDSFGLIHPQTGELFPAQDAVSIGFKVKKILTQFFLKKSAVLFTQMVVLTIVMLNVVFLLLC